MKNFNLNFPGEKFQFNLSRLESKPRSLQHPWIQREDNWGETKLKRVKSVTQRSLFSCMFRFARFNFVLWRLSFPRFPRISSQLREINSRVTPQWDVRTDRNCLKRAKNSWNNGTYVASDSNEMVRTSRRSQDKSYKNYNRYKILCEILSEDLLIGCSGVSNFLLQVFIIVATQHDFSRENHHGIVTIHSNLVCTFTILSRKRLTFTKIYSFETGLSSYPQFVPRWKHAWRRSATETHVLSPIGYKMRAEIQNRATTNQKQCTDLCRATSSVWNFSDAISGRRLSTR